MVVSGEHVQCVWECRRGQRPAAHSSSTDTDPLPTHRTALQVLLTLTLTDIKVNMYIVTYHKESFYFTHCFGI